MTAGAAALAGPVGWPAGPAGAAPGGNLYPQQAAFVEMRFGMFIHFNMATFSDEEWATGGLDPRLFNPTALDCAQWAATARAAGMSWAALTTKHHDGFCLWPTRTTAHNVMSSSHRQDVVRRYVDAFRAEGLTPCFYFSIWDRTQAISRGNVTRADIDFTKAQLSELLGGTYGAIPLLIIDGWAWQMGHREMPYAEIRAHVKAMQPDCLIIDHNGQTEPWEEDAIYFEEPKGIWAPPGNTYASCQGQNVVNTGWFWHPAGSSRGSTADTATRTPANIVDHIRTLEQRYCSFLLNCPPNNRGLLDANIVATLRAVGPMWSPNAARPPLPAQPDALLYPVAPVSAYASSGVAANAIDGWVDWAHGVAVESWWQSAGPLPQSVTMDLGAVHTNIDTVTYLPRQDKDASGTVITTGNVTGYRVLTSLDGTTFTPATTGTWAGGKALKYARFGAVRARFVRLEATAAVGGGGAVINELDCGGIAGRPVREGGAPPTGYVRLVNRRSGKVLAVTGSSTADSAALVQSTDTGGAGQQWQLVDAGGGYTKLVNRASGKVADVTGRSTANGAAVVQYRDTGGTNQHWQLVDAGGGYRKLVNRNSGKVADVTGGSAADGAAVIQYTDGNATNQHWQLVPG
ncbi:MAG TPA: RICIN domain-containing protein [Pilimelia sp.]|nr:RICIN domain-containing protein [Pilimelia sp.]